MATQSVPSSISFDNDAEWSLGGNSVDNPDFRLRDVAVDDVRISGFARYETNFSPPAEYDDDTELVILLLRLDEGRGVVGGDEVGGPGFSIESPAWVVGNAG